MNSTISILKQEVFKKIQSAAAGAHSAETLKLTTVLERLNQIEERERQMEDDIQKMKQLHIVQLEEIKKIMSGQPSLNNAIEPLDFADIEIVRNRAPSRLKIQADWVRVGKSLKKEEINGRSAGVVMAKFIGRLIAELGKPVEDKIKRFGQTQGKLCVTEDPNTDPRFRNRNTHMPYSAEAIPSSKLFVRTAINNHDKKMGLEKLIKFLGLPEGFAKIEVVPE